jgi:hypothetical protein
MVLARRAAAALLLVAWASGCATLPDYAAPQGEVIDPATVDMSDVISYRTLARSDFRGAEPPPAFVPYKKTVGAATCGHILTTPDTNLRVKSVSTASAGVSYRAVAHHLRFRAQMDRNCSWWNPRDLGVPQEYILEHEQIHFALFELEARRLNASVPEIIAQLEAGAPTAEQAAALVQRNLEEVIGKRMREILKRSRAFDEDTSMGFQPERQKTWLRRVQSELAETQRWAEQR